MASVSGSLIVNVLPFPTLDSTYIFPLLFSIIDFAKDKPIPQMLLKKFKTNSAANKYFDKLSNLIEKNTSEDIINTCYYDKFDSNEKVSIFKRIFG